MVILVQGVQNTIKPNKMALGRSQPEWDAGVDLICGFHSAGIADRYFVGTRHPEGEARVPRGYVPLAVRCLE